ncbi:hypothetical protein N431DRAFT_331582 [Stipitochalara longipes BDJ]|nr:hypothetical protein N431DRAFT_331582 [Stipitochalara longipes BDJ]
MAVNHDPKYTFESVQALIKERDELKEANNKLKAENNTLKAGRNGLEVQNNALIVENAKVNENYESAKLDHRVARERIQMMEELISIQSAKQIILWKFIWRLKNGETEPYVDEDGFWRPMKGPMAPVSEASEPSSDRSCASTVGSKDSSETKLDPHAVSPILRATGFTNSLSASFRPPKSCQNSS